MRSPRSVDIEITSRCNADCRYCYYLNNEGVRYEDLPTERWLEFFAELGRAGVMNITLAGGEPFLRPDFMPLLDGIKENRMRFRILTNGSRVTRALASAVASTGRCDYVQVSVDGSKAAVHELMRGRETFEPALRAIRLLKDAGVPVTVRTTIHAGNVEDLPGIARLLLEDLGLSDFGTNAVSSLGTDGKYGDGLFLGAVLRLRAMRILSDLRDKYPGRIHATAGPLAEWMMYNEMEAARLAGRGIPGRGRLVGCGCVFNTMAVRADGAYIPCVTLPQMVLGHIGGDSLLDVWQNSPTLKEFRGRVHKRLDSFEECRDCEYVEACTGNCAGPALSFYGTPHRPSPEGCLRRFRKELAAEGVTIWNG
jgi:SynChlorMet cassette radical SAM/SPASM protein ScmE